MLTMNMFPGFRIMCLLPS